MVEETEGSPDFHHVPRYIGGRVRAGLFIKMEIFFREGKKREKGKREKKGQRKMHESPGFPGFQAISEAIWRRPTRNSPFGTSTIVQR